MTARREIRLQGEDEEERRLFGLESLSIHAADALTWGWIARKAPLLISHITSETRRQSCKRPTKRFEKLVFSTKVFLFHESQNSTCIRETRSRLETSERLFYLSCFQLLNATGRCQPVPLQSYLHLAHPIPIRCDVDLPFRNRFTP